VIVRVDLIFKRLVETPDMRTVAGLAFAMLLAIPVGLYAVPSWSQAYMLDEMVVDYRQLIMKSQDAHAAAIGTILTGTVPNDNIASHFEALLITTRQTRVAFKPEALGGDALPSIWEEGGWEDFSAKLDLAEKNIIIAIEAIKKNGVGAAGDVTLAALRCKDCHETYRKKK
jgi:cytochrome c556